MPGAYAPGTIRPRYAPRIGKSKEISQGRRSTIFYAVSCFIGFSPIKPIANDTRCDHLITFIDGQMPSHLSSCVPLWNARNIFVVEDKDLIRSSWVPTESGSGRFPEKVGARFVRPGPGQKVSGPTRVRALRGLLKKRARWTGHVRVRASKWPCRLPFRSSVLDLDAVDEKKLSLAAVNWT